MFNIKNSPDKVAICIRDEIQSWGLDNLNMKKIFSFIMQYYYFINQLTRLYEFSDFIEIIHLMYENEEEMEFVSRGRTTRKVQVINANIIATILLRFYDKDYFSWTPDDLSEDDIDDGAKVGPYTDDEFDAIPKEQVKGRIEELYERTQESKRFCKKLLGRNRNGGSVPLMGYMAGKIYEYLNKIDAISENESDTYRRILKLLLIIFDRPEGELSAKEQVSAVKSWIKSYNRLGVKISLWDIGKLGTIVGALSQLYFDGKISQTVFSNR